MKTFYSKVLAGTINPVPAASPASSSVSARCRCSGHRRGQFCERLRNHLLVDTERLVCGARCVLLLPVASMMQPV